MKLDHGRTAAALALVALSGACSAVPAAPPDTRSPPDRDPPVVPAEIAVRDASAAEVTPLDPPPDARAPADAGAGEALTSEAPTDASSPADAGGCGGAGEPTCEGGVCGPGLVPMNDPLGYLGCVVPGSDGGACGGTGEPCCAAYLPRLGRSAAVFCDPPLVGTSVTSTCTCAAR